jgi:D-alanyl-D-alanine dipeptidase
MISLVTRLFRLFLALPLSIFASFFSVPTALQAQTAPVAANSILPGPKPSDAPAEWKEFLGIYGTGKDALIVLERDQKLYLSDEKKTRPPLLLDSDGHLKNAVDSIQLNDCFSIHSDNERKTPFLLSCLSSRQPLPRTDAGSDPAQFYHVTPTRPVEELREKALKLSPPAETGPFRKPDLVELLTLDPAIHLDIRYASFNNFLSTPVYTEARAFMQRPAAEALLRVLRKLQPIGYGLLIHDAYRPWYVTKIFWDATPPAGKIFVADPQKGSKHNRGCAVDLTLYDLATGQPVEMPGLYDEMSPRSFPNFPGGTSLQRWHRDLLRRAMESAGFTVNEDEWWHFDYKDWKQYGILNVPFEKIADSLQPTPVSH